MNTSAISLSWICLVLGTVLAPINTVWFTTWLMPGDPLFLLAGLIVLLKAAGQRGPLWLPAWLLPSLLLIVAGPLANALPGGVVREGELAYPVSMIIAMFVVPFVIASHRSATPRQLAWLLAAFIAATVLQAVIAIGQSAHLMPRWMDPVLLPNWGSRVSAMTFNPGILGLFLALLVPVCLALALDSLSWPRFIGMLAITLLLVYATDLTGTRGALIAAVVSALFTMALFWTRASDAGMRFLQVTAVAVAIVLLWQFRAGFDDSAVQRLLGVSDTAIASTHERWILMRLSLDQFWESPIFGRGYGDPHLAHNVVLGLLRAGGITALIGFALLHVGYASYVLRLFFMARRGEVAFGIGAGFLGMLVAWLVMCVGSTPFVDRVQYVGFGLAILYAVTHSRQAREPHFAVSPRTIPNAATAGL